MSFRGIGRNGPRARRHARRTIIAGAVLAALGVTASGAAAAPFAFEPITIQRINLPSEIKEATMPSFTKDGHHLLFFSEGELWITTLGGAEVHCLSCGLANDPKIIGADLATPFPEGKRVFFGGNLSQPGTSKMAVLECKPSVVRCESASILPVDFANAQPEYIQPGGAVSGYQLDLGGAYHAKLSPDGEYVGFSDIRSDSIESMVVAKLRKTAAQYEVIDARVIDPAGPSSPSDTGLSGWSESSALFEFKTFTDGGADATYVQAGGDSLLNPDVWSVNLATGQRTRLTANPEWDEDNGVSPNGELMALWSTRTLHYVDWFGGLLPVRSFIDAPASAMSAGVLGGWDQCHGPMWLLPASGDEDGSLAGEPIVDYDEPGAHVVNNIEGWNQWSPNGTMIALTTQKDGTGSFLQEGATPYLLVAHLTARKPAAPLPAVSSEPGAWAPTPDDYHGAMGFDGVLTLDGAGGGTVTVSYGGVFGAIDGGEWTETYDNYSEDGTDFVNGSVRVSTSEEGEGFDSHLTMTGANTGDDEDELTFKSGHISGHGESSYDGNTVSGPSEPEANSEACPSLLPKKPALQVTASKVGEGTYEVKVTASVAGVGLNEAQTSTSPVNHALLLLGKKKAYTDAEGIAVVPVTKDHELTVTAGETLEPASTYLE